MYSSIYAYIILAFFICSCAQNSLKTRTPSMVDGTEVNELDMAWSFTAKVEGREKNKAIVCTGVLIARNTLLTSSKCLSDKKVNIIFWYNNNKYEFISSQIKIIDSQLGLVTLDLEFSNRFQPITMEFNLEAWKNTKNLFVSGFGATDKNTHVDAQHPRLMEVEQEILSENPEGTFQIAGTNNSESSFSHLCDGDSGAPVYLIQGSRFILVGIGISNSCSAVSKFIPLSKYKNILDKIK